MTAPLVRLADRIRAADRNVKAFDPVLLVNQYAPAVTERFRYIHRALRYCPVIVADNCAEYYYAGNDKEYWDVRHDFPVLVPPFGQFWVEWCQPSIIRSTEYGDHDASKSAFPIAGCLIDTYPVDGTIPRAWGSDPHWRENWHALSDGARWVMCLMPCGFIDDMFAVPAGAFWLAVDERGTVTEYVTVSYGGRDANELLGFEAPLFIHPALITLTFLNIKNGTITPAELHVPEKFARTYARRHDLPLVRYHTVIVDPSRTTKPTLPGAGGDRKMPVHLVRGHLVTYGGEHGLLFGKYSGTYFRPPHVRGSKSEGVALHDYRVKAPKGGSNDGVRTGTERTG